MRHPKQQLVAAVLTMVAVVVSSGCGSSSNQSTTSSPTGAVTATTVGTTAANSGPANTITIAGFQYQVALGAGGVATKTSFTTDDGTGAGGTTITAPPGQVLITAPVEFANHSGRQELFMPATQGALPDASGALIILAIPQADASAFGLDAHRSSQDCTTKSASAFSQAPQGYCTLEAGVGAFSPALQGGTTKPPLAAGASGTVVMVAGSLVGTVPGPSIPQNAPVQDVKVYMDKSSDCAATAPCWVQVS
jgi:hypothetical protein